MKSDLQVIGGCLEIHTDLCPDEIMGSGDLLVSFGF